MMDAEYEIERLRRDEANYDLRIRVLDYASSRVRVLPVDQIIAEAKALFPGVSARDIGVYVRSAKWADETGKPAGHYRE